MIRTVFVTPHISAQGVLKQILSDGRAIIDAGGRLVSGKLA